MRWGSGCRVAWCGLRLSRTHNQWWVWQVCTPFGDVLATGGPFLQYDTARRVGRVTLRAFRDAGKKAIGWMP